VEEMADSQHNQVLGALLSPHREVPRKDLHSHRTGCGPRDQALAHGPDPRSPASDCLTQ
jgi:hypothetical protein